MFSNVLFFFLYEYYMDAPTEKKKRVLTPEQLEKLRLARVRALEVRQNKASKIRELKTLEKMKQEHELDSKLEELKNHVEPVKTSQQVVEPITKVKKNPQAKIERVTKKIERLIEQESDSSNSDDDDDDETDVVSSFLKNKYKQKYKTKYQSKIDHQLMKGKTREYISNRVNEDAIRLASMQLFS